MSDQRLKGISWTFGHAVEPSDPLNDAYQKLEQAEGLRQQGQLDRAQATCEPLVARYPEYFGALYTLGLIFLDKQQYPQALGCLVRAVMLNPRSWRALTALSAVYLELGASEMAAHSLEQANRVKPDDPSILLTLGETYREEREYELARDAYHRAYAMDRTLVAAGIGLGSCYADLGQFAEAAEIFQDLLKSGVRYPNILLELNNLPSSFVQVDLLSEIKKIARGRDDDEKDFNNTADFVRAAVFDRAGHFAEAWELLLSANRVRHLARRKEAEELSSTQRANLAQLEKKRIEIRGDSGADGRTISLFILGPSRSGKTTMEALVGSLEGVKRGYENPAVENAVRRTFQTAGLLTSKLFEVLPPKLDPLCQELYLKELAPRAKTAKVFTNTDPVRIHDVARVTAAFPDVRFIFVKRNIDDNMLRIFMRKYQAGNAYAYDLKSIREHITWYHQMIDVLAEKIPDIVRVIHYENMVADPSSALRMAADLCGLAVKDTHLPKLGDDRNCSEPYRAMIAAALNS